METIDPAAYETELVACEELKPHPRNYRRHPADQLAHIEASIKQHGFYRNVVVARDGTILAGHGVVEAARKLGLAQIPVIRLPIPPDSPAALKVLTGDNEIARLVEADDRVFTELLKEIKDTDELLGTGYDAQMLAALLLVTRPASEIADKDEAAEWLGMPEYGGADDTPKLVVSFRSKQDRQKFIEQTEISMARKNESNLIWSGWWPAKEREDLIHVMVEG